MKPTPKFIVGTVWEKTRLANMLIAEALSACPDDIVPAEVKEHLVAGCAALQKLEYALRQYRSEEGS